MQTPDRQGSNQPDRYSSTWELLQEAEALPMLSRNATAQQIRLGVGQRPEQGSSRSKPPFEYEWYCKAD